jgi:predicted DCC family thiol-disulfide oxidoreductase YuxK
MTSLIRLWNRFWFESAPAADLAVARLVFFGGLAAFYAPHHFAGWADVTPALWEPIWLFDRFHIPVLPYAVIRILEVTWKLSLFMACIGLLTPVSIFTSAVLGTYLLGLPHNFGQTYHFDAVLVLAFWILAFSRAGDAWSVDALVRAARRSDDRRPAASPEYRWPVQLVLVALSFVFFAAGVAKISRAGLEWITSDHMALLLRRVQYHISDADPLVNWGVLVASVPAASSLMAFTTVFVETAYPLALFSRRLRVPMVVAGIALILGIRLLMGPTFEHFLLINAFWVPWVRVGAWIRQRLPARQPMRVMYDGGCGICVPGVRVLRRLDLLRRVEFLDAVADWNGIARLYPSLRQDACLTEMHGVTPDGRVAVGFDAYREMAKVMPLGWLVLPFLYIPPVPALGRKIYRAIADRRHRAGCPLPETASGGVQLPSPAPAIESGAPLGTL